MHHPLKKQGRKSYVFDKRIISEDQQFGVFNDGHFRTVEETNEVVTMSSGPNKDCMSSQRPSTSTTVAVRAPNQTHRDDLLLSHSKSDLIRYIQLLESNVQNSKLHNQRAGDLAINNNENFPNLLVNRKASQSRCLNEPGLPRSSQNPMMHHTNLAVLDTASSSSEEMVAYVKRLKEKLRVSEFLSSEISNNNGIRQSQHPTESSFQCPSLPFNPSERSNFQSTSQPSHARSTEKM